MVRLAGVDLPLEKRIDIALISLYGVGRSNVWQILNSAKIDPGKRTKALSEEEVVRLQKVLKNYKIEGDLRQEVRENIKRLKEIGSYRGGRHTRNLPVRGQRTRSNARAKRGKRVTIGALRKKAAEKMGLLQKPKEEGAKAEKK